MPRRDAHSQKALLDDNRNAYLQQQLETQKNRMKNQNSLKGVPESSEAPANKAEDGVNKYARGGVAITISSVP